MDSDSTSAVAPTEQLVLDALHALDHALERATFYPFAHPIAVQARDSYTAKWLAAVKECGRVRILVAADRLGVDAHEVMPVERSTRVVCLARYLHSIDITAITYSPSVTPEDLEEFLGVLVAARREDRPAQILEPWSAADSGRGVHVALFETRTLRFSMQANDINASNPWQRLQAFLNGGGGEADAVVVANALANTIQDHEGVGVGYARDRLRRSLRAASPEEKPEMARRLRRLCELLPEDFREDLLQVRLPAASDGLLSDLVRVLPAEEAIGAFFELGVHKGALSTGSQMVLNQLLGSLPGQIENDPRVQQVLDTPPLDAGELRRAIETLIGPTGACEYNPEEYSERLRALATVESLVVPPDVLARFGEPTPGEEMRLQAAAVAVSVLDGAEAADREALLHRVVADRDVLLDRERLDLVEHALAQAAAFESTASSSLRECFASQGTVRRLIEIAVSADRLREIAALLPSGAVLSEIVRHLSTCDETSRSGWENLLLEYDGPELSHVISASAEDAAARFQALESVLGCARSRSVRAAVRRLAKHPHLTVRMVAMTTVLEWDGPEASVAMLESTLQASETRLAHWAVAHLAESDVGARTLAEFLTSGTRIPRVIAVGAVRALLGRGDDGAAFLTRALDRLRGSLSRRSAHRARLIAAGLAPVASRTDVSSALARWRRSVSRLISAWLPAPADEEIA